MTTHSKNNLKLINHKISSNHIPPVCSTIASISSPSSISNCSDVDVSANLSPSNKNLTVCGDTPCLLH